MHTDRKKRVAELADQYGPMVFATAYRILGNADDAEDALQEVFLKLLGGWWDRLKAERIRNWGGYLRVTTVRIAIELLRRRRRRGEEALTIVEDRADPSAADPRALAIGSERAGQLRSALARLPKREARVFALRYFEESSYEQIAEELGLRVRRVGVLLFRARGRLRKILKPLALEDNRNGNHRRPSGCEPDASPDDESGGLGGKEKSHVAG